MPGDAGSIRCMHVLDSPQTRFPLFAPEQPIRITSTRPGCASRGSFRRPGTLQIGIGSIGALTRD
jgi:hypothetical protein